MQHNPFVNETHLHQKSDFSESQGIVPELIYRLVTASIQNPSELRIPSIINQPGWDGIIVSPIAFDPFVPAGKSFWEIGTGNDPQSKASSDFLKRTKETSANERAETTYVFVTSRSSAFGVWDITDQEKWKKRRRNRGWKDIRIIDATRLQHWLSRFPEIDLWLAQKFGLTTQGFDSPALYWKQLANFGAPPPLKPIVFIDKRENVKQEILKIFQKQTMELRIETFFPEEAIDLVVAVLESLPEIEQFTYSGRCLIIGDIDTWKTMCTLTDHYVLVAKPNLDLGGTGAELRNLASTYGKSVIFSTTPSTSSHGSTIKLPEISSFHLYNNLKSCGYREERARQISEKCKGKITTLKRILMDLSVSPEWSRTDMASDLAIASLIGQWNANEKGDIDVATAILGKEYGEWIPKIRPLTLISDPPLTQQNEKWRFISRYEGWQNLGKYISDYDLDKFSEWTITVLKEKDPKFDLPKDERWLANAKGKKKNFSDTLIMGLVETLALIGTYPDALSSVSTNKAKLITARTIQEIFKKADWKNWATLNDYLPLLAEADPNAFLDALEETVAKKEIINELFMQEGGGITGWNYMTGILWALETLAWSEKYITRVCLILCDLLLLDPGGSWVNRPYNSLLNILLPWIKQTVARIEKKKIVITNIKAEYPEIVWRLILDVLPTFGGKPISPNRKPTWRNFIPEEFTEIYTKAEQWQQVDFYLSLCTEFIKTNFDKLLELVKRIDDIPEPYFSNILEYLEAPEIKNKSEENKTKIWELLEEIERKHKKFFDAKWALSKEQISKIEKTKTLLIPVDPLHKHLYLFNHFGIDLYEDRDNFEQQRNILENLRTNAVKEIYDSKGVGSIIDFAKSSKFPVEVGAALGRNTEINEDDNLIPGYLNHKEKEINEFVRGYITSKFQLQEFKWVKKFNLVEWNIKQKLELLSILPFLPETWLLAKKILKNDYEKYWESTNATPYFLNEKDFSPAIKLLLKFKRPRATIRIMEWMLHKNIPLDINKVYNALLSDITKDEKDTPLDPHPIVQLIKWIQHQKHRNEEILFEIEWIYLRWLDSYSGASPKTLHKALATDPAFFCDVIRTIYKSKNENIPKETYSEKKAKAEQAYYLLQDWTLIPGLKANKEIDAEFLDDWLSKVKKECSQTGHLVVALQTVGKVLAHSPKDISGLFINKAVAEILNRRNHAEIRRGYATERFNMRGVFYGTSGEGEMALAQDYDQKAEEVEKENFSRLATSLRDMARWYKLDAEREKASDHLT